MTAQVYGRANFQAHIADLCLRKLQERWEDASLVQQSAPQIHPGKTHYAVAACVLEPNFTNLSEICEMIRLFCMTVDGLVTSAERITANPIDLIVLFPQFCEEERAHYVQIHFYA